jgi:hypothetical protein
MSYKAIYSTAKATGSKFLKGDLGVRKAMAHEGRSAAKQQTKAASTRVQAAGRGLSTMRNKGVKTGLIVGAGMGVAAGMRNTGSGTSSGSSSLYRH